MAVRVLFSLMAVQMGVHGWVTFDLALVTLSYKILSRLYFGNCKVLKFDTR